MSVLSQEPTTTAGEVVAPARRLAVRVILPAGAFLGGFVWDVFTLGREIKSTDLLILGGYFGAAATILVLMGREVRFRGSARLNLVLQFLFGGMFSALVVLYFMSSGAVLSFLVVLGLAAILVTNEFLGERYRRLSLSWAVFGVCGIMLLNFLLPTVMGSIHPGWFYASLAVGTGGVFGLRRLSCDEDAVVWPTLAAACVLAVLQYFNLIPPVPLASRAMVAGSEVKRDGNDFVVRGRIVSAASPFRSNVLVRERGGSVACFTSIFVPKGIETEITHRWMKRDVATGEWKTTDRIAFPIVGGRRGGYRGYTVKQQVDDGEWKVVAESKNGSVIATTRFRVATGGAKQGRPFERRF